MYTDAMCMVRAPPKTWDKSTDVVVIGSGTGLAGTLAASERRADVLVLEKSPYIGGTTAISGGGSLAPNSPQVVDAVGETSREALMTYLERITKGSDSSDRGSDNCSSSTFQILPSV
jgi:succinate dehydrogenase/fumarate reductase flavoprotein subunit